MKINLAAMAIIYFMALAASAQAAPIIIVGNHNLQPNLAGQLISIFVSGGDAVQGVDFNVQIGDGGAITGGTDIGPFIEDVDILAGIFSSNNTGQTDGISPLLWNSSTTTASGTVSADGLLAILTISTVGFGPGTVKDLSLTPDEEFGGATNFAGIEALITNGSITVVPEPATLTLLLAAAAALIARRRVAL